MKKLLLAVLTLSFAGAAAAADEYRFAYTTSDFTDVTSVHDLNDRITQTARDYCPGYLPSKDLAEIRRCVQDVTSDIVQSIDNAALSALTTGDENDVRIALEQQRHPQHPRG
jgi:UrcA family protein